MTVSEKFLQRLRGKTAWLSGGKRIGQTVARALAEQGVNLVLTYRTSRDEAEQTAAAAERLGVQTLIARADVSNRAEVVRAVAAAGRKFRAIDILVNMASVF